MASRVRQYARRTASGGTTTVHQHSRRGRGRKRGLVSPRHAWRLARRALRAARRRKRATAAVLGGLAVAELLSWFALRGVGFLLATAAVLAIAAASLAMAATGGEL
jgi:hypothetical protein